MAVRLQMWRSVTSSRILRTFSHLNDFSLQCDSQIRLVFSLPYIAVKETSDSAVFTRHMLKVNWDPFKMDSLIENMRKTILVDRNWSQYINQYKTINSFAFTTLTNCAVWNQNEPVLTLQVSIVLVSSYFRLIIHEWIILIVSQGWYLSNKTR